MRKKYGRPREVTDDNKTRRMLFAYRITKTTDTHSEHVILATRTHGLRITENIPADVKCRWVASAPVFGSRPQPLISSARSCNPEAIRKGFPCQPEAMREREEIKSFKNWIASNLKEFTPLLSWIYHVELPSLETRVM